MSDLSQAVIGKITTHFLQSSDFNGLPLTAIVKIVGNEGYARAELKKLVVDGAATCAFSSVSDNPHIKRFSDLPLPEQLSLLDVEPVDGICAYPARSMIESATDVSLFNDRPFTKDLLLGEAQLQLRAFDPGVLDRYINDPRYDVILHDYSGTIAISEYSYLDNAFPERDKVLLEDFGVGYTSNRERLTVSLLRYLSKLSPEHQQYWNSFRYDGKFVVLDEYFKNSVLGEWTDTISYFQAIAEEIRLINEITHILYDRPMFRNEFHDDRPPGMTFFLRPTLKNFNEFILAMDKVLSENLRHDFFDGKVATKVVEVRSDGTRIVKHKGSLALFEEWLFLALRWRDEEEAKRIIVAPLKRVRKLRQKPAHKVEKNVFSHDYEKEQREILGEVYNSLASLRETLNKHPKAGVEVPEALVQGWVRFF